MPWNSQHVSQNSDVHSADAMYSLPHVHSVLLMSDDVLHDLLTRVHLS